MWNLPVLPPRSAATVNVVATPSVTGMLLSTVSVGADQADIHPADNQAMLATTVMDAPGLAIILQGSSVQLAWPAASGFILQAADRLAPGNWTDVGVPPQLIGGHHIVTLGAGSQHKFFRLRSP